MIRNTRSFLLDTGAFLQIIEDITPVPPDAILVSFDVKDLYTSIPHTDGIHSTRWLLSNNNTNSGLIDLCCTLLSVVLNNNFFLFEDSYYLQTKGSAMGSNVAPPYANAYMAHYEDTLIYTNSLFRQHVLTWKRYIDDIFCIWKGDLDSLQIFFQFLKNAWPGLDFTMSHDPHQISFLDTLVKKDTDGHTLPAPFPHLALSAAVQVERTTIFSLWVCLYEWNASLSAFGGHVTLASLPLRPFRSLRAALQRGH
ncbi:unnamed protein product [Ranitomeya imitator]|uniref:Reverse transcriptase domain-containing protein n=1 Tax=Ranitomeya imitator TaxID=111125 RepID=A0ABN9LE91_9NEOB|nr:unnamed protein product [Ranitomeya imitator]